MEGKNEISKGLEYMNSNRSAFYFLVMVARGYFFNLREKVKKYENTPFKKTNLAEYARTFFKPRFDEKIEEKDKDLGYIFSDQKSDRSDAFRKARVHFVEDLRETISSSRLIW
jgi:hypothetical protein